MYGLHNPEVHADVTLRMVVGGERTLAVSCTLAYSASAPFEVRALFRAGEEAVVWAFARDLLQEGLVRPSGDGDITVWPDRNDAEADVVYIALNSPSGEALLEADRADISTFVDEMYSAVPAGAESNYVDTDALIRALLADEPHIAADAAADVDSAILDLFTEAEIAGFDADAMLRALTEGDERDAA